MDKIQSSFTVFFEDPFWVGIFERRQPHKGQDLLTAAKVTFGAQPTDAQVYVYLLEHYHQLRFSPSGGCQTSPCGTQSQADAAANPAQSALSGRLNQIPAGACFDASTGSPS